MIPFIINKQNEVKMIDFYSPEKFELPSANETEELEFLIPLIYAELRKLAAFHLRNERPNHTLRPTELVHECNAPR